MEINNQKQKYNFFVDKYQTPFATVDIKTPKFRTFTDPIVPLNVNCFYTFGKPVTGSANILISKLEECRSRVENLTYWSNQYNISGQLETRIDFRDTKLLDAKCESKFNLTVIIHDSIINQEYINYKIIEFHQQIIITKNLNALQKIKPGLNFRVFIKFLNIEGNEVDVNKLNELQYEAQLVLNTGSVTNTIPMAIVKKNDNMVLDFQTDPSTIQLNLKLIIDDKMIANYSYSSYTACKKVLIQVKLQEALKPLSVGGIANLIVTGTEAIDYLSFYFLVKGDIINTSSIVVASPEINVLIPILLKKEMAPDLTVVVYYYSKASGILAFDSLNLQIDGLFQNDVEIQVEKTSLDVSQNVKFSVKTQPDSQLLILGIDKAVIRENVNSYITESLVIDQLRNIQETKNVANGDITSSINFGSNAIPQCSTFYDLSIVEIDEPEFEDVVKLRKDFRKTWIWDRIVV